MLVKIAKEVIVSISIAYGEKQKLKKLNTMLRKITELIAGRSRIQIYITLFAHEERPLESFAGAPLIQTHYTLVLSLQFFPQFCFHVVTCIHIL